MKNRLSSAITLRTMMLVLVSGGILLFVALTFNVLYQVEKLNQFSTREHRRLAEEEINGAVALIYEQAHQTLVKLKDWDEVYQQLTSPAYYAYWRQQREKSGYELPDYVVDIELYKPDRTSLIKPVSSDLPEKLPEADEYLMASNGRLWLYLFTPVHDRIEKYMTIGYAGIKIDVVKALLNLNHFSHIQAGSIAVNDFAGRKLLEDSGDIVSLLKYNPVALEKNNVFEVLIKRNLIIFSVLIAGMIIMFYLIMRFFISRPLEDLVQAIDSLKYKNASRILQADSGRLSIYEIKMLKNSLLNYQLKLEKVQSELDTQNLELWRMAHHDPLTGSYNRRAFDRDWRKLIDVVSNQRLSVSYILFDCDHFKAINDTYGHEIGDNLIKHIAEQLQASFRKGDKLYRLGGDEFATFILGGDMDAIRMIAERCQKSVLDYDYARIGIKEPVTLSIGIASASDADKSRLLELPKQADLAMYHAKSSSYTIQFYTEEMGGNSSILSARMVNAVMRAVKQADNLCLHYQPVVKLDDNSTVYYEALVRLNDEGGIIYPNDIFPVIDRHALDAEFDQAIIRNIVRDLHEGRIAAGTGVSINLSAASLVKHDLMNCFDGLLEFLSAYTIIVEVTETSLITRLDQATENLRKLQAHGFYVALDDFGSGYSSIRYLANMPVDIVKFDITMVQALNESEQNRQIVSHVARLILDAGYTLVTEGIEDEQTLVRVIEMGAGYAQGYYFGRPQRLELQQEATGEGRGTSGK